MLEQKTAGKVKCNILPRARRGAARHLRRRAQRPGRPVVHGARLHAGPLRHDADGRVAVPGRLRRGRPRSPSSACTPSTRPSPTSTRASRCWPCSRTAPASSSTPSGRSPRSDDLAGLKLRVGGGMVNEISKALGMNVTLKPAPESYELLSTGVMDGTLFPAESVEVVQDRQGHQVRHHLPRRPVQHQLRLHDEPGQVRQACRPT